MENSKTYIIGDVHGCINTLKALVNKLPKNAKIIFVGDLIDRGKNSSDVIEFVINGKYDCVMGNHEQSMCSFLPSILKDKSTIDNHSWTIFGGYETMKSYGLVGFSSTKYKLLDKHLLWLNKLPIYLEYPHLTNEEDRYLVVSHAAIHNTWKYKDHQPSTEGFQKFKEQILNNRCKTIYDNEEIFNIFGHTPVGESLVTKHFANIDTGCIFNDGDLLGNLTAIEFPSMKIISQKNID